MQITMPAPHHSVFYRPDALPAAQPTASKHWMQRRPDILQRKLKKAKANNCTSQLVQSNGSDETLAQTLMVSDEMQSTSC